MVVISEHKCVTLGHPVNPLCDEHLLCRPGVQVDTHSVQTNFYFLAGVPLTWLHSSEVAHSPA